MERVLSSVDPASTQLSEKNVSRIQWRSCRHILIDTLMNAVKLYCTNHVQGLVEESLLNAQCRWCLHLRQGFNAKHLRFVEFYFITFHFIKKGIRVNVRKKIQTSARIKGRVTDFWRQNLHCFEMPSLFLQSPCVLFRRAHPYTLSSKRFQNSLTLRLMNKIMIFWKYNV